MAGCVRLILLFGLAAGPLLGQSFGLLTPEAQDPGFEGTAADGMTNKWVYTTTAAQYGTATGGSACGSRHFVWSTTTLSPAGRQMWFTNLAGISPNTVYTASVYWKTTSGAHLNGGMRIVHLWYDSAGTQIASNVGSTNMLSAAGSWERHFSTALSPPLAVYASFRIQTWRFGVTEQIARFDCAALIPETAAPSGILRAVLNPSPAVSVARLSPVSDDISLLGFRITNDVTSPLIRVCFANTGSLPDAGLTNLRLYRDDAETGLFGGGEFFIADLTEDGGVWSAEGLRLLPQEDYLVVGKIRRTAGFGGEIRLMIPVNGLVSSNGCTGPEAPLVNTAVQTVATSRIVINEVADAPSSGEFVELKGQPYASLFGFNLKHFNQDGAAGGGPLGGAAGLSLDAFAIPASGYLVIGDPSVPHVAYSAGFSDSASDIQDGPGDALRLLAPDGCYTDSVIWGAGWTGSAFTAEGASPWAPDPAAGSSIGRIPDGTDTDDNAADFGLLSPSPGAANAGGVADFVFAPSNRPVGSLVSSLTLRIFLSGPDVYTALVLSNNSALEYGAGIVAAVLTNGVVLESGHWSVAGLTLSLTNLRLEESVVLDIVYEPLRP